MSFISICMRPLSPSGLDKLYRRRAGPLPNLTLSKIDYTNSSTAYTGLEINNRLF